MMGGFQPQVNQGYMNQGRPANYNSQYNQGYQKGPNQGMGYVQ